MANEIAVIYPNLAQVEIDVKAVKTALRNAGVNTKTINSVQTKALRTGRKTTGEWATNRENRWSIVANHPQYGTERDCKAIFVKLCAQVFCFDGAPDLDDDLRHNLEDNYLGHVIAPGALRDSLLQERFSFADFCAEGEAPVHGHSGFHIGHEGPTIVPKHQIPNISWRTYRSNLIQGNMTLRQARIYFVKLIARYFELGELDIG
jgi:hypothetical protein